MKLSLPKMTISEKTLDAIQSQKALMGVQLFVTVLGIAGLSGAEAAVKVLEKAPKK